MLIILKILDSFPNLSNDHSIPRQTTMIFRVQWAIILVHSTHWHGKLRICIVHFCAQKSRENGVSKDYCLSILSHKNHIWTKNADFSSNLDKNPYFLFQIWFLLVFLMLFGVIPLPTKVNGWYSLMCIDGLIFL